MLCDSTHRCDARLHSWRRRSSRGRSLAVLGQSAPPAEFKSRDLRTMSGVILLSKQFCDPRNAHNVSGLVYSLKQFKSLMDSCHSHQAA
ncbi:unnamed protein product [Hymenolepis diminuta]|uniref:Uncharacterized protein n=1 Tax=Hymenolepis diminuta TaxID=6216 RepID=A0A564Z628_HYMDI|nr:unnamed protein product [Hymenolepis diminuta]